jgi:hypothetical protein
MLAHRPHAAGGGPPARTRVWSQSRFQASRVDPTKLAPWHRQWGGQRQLLFVAGMMPIDSLSLLGGRVTHKPQRLG